MKNFTTQTLAPAKKAAIFICCILASAACKKAETGNPLAGNYSGKAIFVGNGVIYTKEILGADFSFTNTNYSASTYSISSATNSTTGTNTGSYQAKTDSITFNPDKTIPTTLQGSQVFLNGTYEYHYEGDSLIITKSYLQFSFNQYRLKKK